MILRSVERLAGFLLANESGELGGKPGMASREMRLNRPF